MHSSFSQGLPVSIASDVFLVRMRQKPHSRTYWLENQHESVLFNPGGTLGQEEDFERIRRDFPLERIRYIVVNSALPEACGALPYLEKRIGRDDLLIVTQGQMADSLRQMGVRSSIYPIDQRNFQLSRPGFLCHFIPTPYCPCPGSFVTCFPEKGLLFSGELFGNTLSAGILHHEDDFEAIAQYHSQAIPNSQLLGLALSRIQSLTVQTILPNRGPVITATDIAALTSGMEAMAALLSKKSIQAALETYGEVVERKHLEQALEKSHQLEQEVTQQAALLDIVTNSVSDLIFYKDCQLRYIGCNKAFADFVGLNTEDIVDKSDEDLFEPTYARFFRLFEEKVLARQQPEASLGWSWKDDNPEEMRRFISSTSLLRSHSGQVIGIVTVSRDWTRQWKAEQKLASLNRHLEERVQEELEKNRKQNALILQQSRHAIMGEMLSMIAHQWRQPLSAISMAVGTLDTYQQMGILTEKDINVAVTDIEQQTDYLSRVIEDFRNFFRPTSSREDIPIPDLVSRCLALMGHLFARNSIVLQNLTATREPVNVHTNEIIQVIVNILKNAFDVLSERSVENPVVTFRDSVEDGELCLEIEDNGGGIPEKFLPLIFDPYFSTKENKNGTGLGLYMSKVIMEEHNHGSIHARNSAGGAVFQLRFHRNRSTP
ncbi:PAS domain-containing protein [Desulfurispirillum indicum]|uniref:ATP-binding protein n=1 Tax=Desulfurispirillum indicum TaxID=936456 RepID=UPI001CFBBBBC|nr:ATP-binding protein [Desulfurispirillum indicum]UCZ56797.1 PAS domain-containing protein [Desulfurispirillum indicum]